jgi:hypothetical protein
MAGASARYSDAERMRRAFRFRPNWHRLKWYFVLTIGLAGTAAAAFILIFASGEAFGWVAFFFSLLCAAMALHELWPRLIEGAPTAPDIVLQRYPGPVTLRTPRRKLIFILISTIIFGGCLLWLALYSDMDVFGLFFMWLGAIGCAAAVPAFLIAIQRGSTLRLDQQGMQVWQGLKTSTHRWADVSEFSVVDVGMRMVVFDDMAIADGSVVQFNRSVTGRGGGLPDSYGMPPEHLAWLLNEWRARALANPPPPSQSFPAP